MLQFIIMLLLLLSLLAKFKEKGKDDDDEEEEERAQVCTVQSSDANKLICQLHVNRKYKIKIILMLEEFLFWVVYYSNFTNYR